MSSAGVMEAVIRAPGPAMSGSRSAAVGRPELKTSGDMKLHLDFTTLEPRESTSTSSMTLREFPALQTSVSAELDQLFLRWCAEDTSQALISELLIAAKTLPSGSPLDYRNSLHKVMQSMGGASAVSSPSSFVSRSAGLMLSPRGNKSPYTGINSSPGGSSVSSGQSSPSPSRARSTPPMSPTSGLSTSGGFRGPPLSSPGQGRSPPTSPRHFTFPGGGTQLFLDSDSVNAKALNVDTASQSPSSPVAAHTGVGIAMNILSPSSGSVSLTASPENTRGEEAGKAESPLRAISKSPSAPSPRSLGSSPQQTQQQQHNNNSPHTSPHTSPQTKASIIAAANSEAFPLSPPNSVYVSPSSQGSSRSPTTTTTTLHHATSAFPITPDKVRPDVGESKESADSVATVAEEKMSTPRAKPRVDSDQRAPHSTTHTARPLLGALSANIPSFYHAGEGGRGRGKRNPEESLEHRLPAILDLFRRNNAAAAVPIPSEISGTRRSGKTERRNSQTKDTSDSPVNIQTAGVTISWDDAHLALPVESFAAVAKTLCGFPSFFAAPLFRRIRTQFAPRHLVQDGAIMTPALGFTGHVDNLVPAGAEVRQPASASEKPLVVLSIVETKASKDNAAERDTTGVIPLPLFLAYWRSEMEPHDGIDRFFRLVKCRSACFMESMDFMPFMEELLAFHPGLAFLESTPEFQEKYARTVIARIFYVLDPTAKKVIDARQLRRSNLIEAFHTVDIEEDINMVNDYFSYEHFYVLYCKFWELDSDHDFFLTRADLSKMTDLTSAVLDRVFAGCGRPLVCALPGKMAFEDFVVFFMSEEDKTSEAALRYWFNVCDVDGDGALTPRDLKIFYQEQEQRMRSFGMEVIQFADVVCQMHDLLKPKVEGHITIQDFLHPDRCKLTGVLFSAMFNLAKFQAFEARDPVIVKQELNLHGISQWDRYAQAEYARLANEEEAAVTAASSGPASPRGGFGSFEEGGGMGMSMVGSLHLEDDDDDRDGPMSMRNFEPISLGSTIGRR